MRSEATTVAQYLEELPAERRAPMVKLVDFIRATIPPGYREEMSFGMPAWVVPLERYPDTYNKQPLGYVALASQKQGMSMYLSMSCRCIGLDTETVLREAWTRAGKRFDMGRSCLRFKKLEDLEFDALETVISSTPMETFIAEYERVRAEHTVEGRKKAAKAAAASESPSRTGASAKAKAAHATTKPATKKSATKKSATAKPATKKSATKMPATKKSATKKPATAKPAAKKSATAKPAAKKSATAKPAAKKPATAKPAAKKPATAKPAAKKSATAKKAVLGTGSKLR